MWIVPKNHSLYSAFSQGMVESSEDLSLLASDAELPLTSRSKLMPLPTWYRKWKPDTWLRHLFGRTLKHCQRTSFETALMSSLVVIPARASPRLDNEKDQKTRDISGLPSGLQSDLFAPDNASSKMLRATYRLDSAQCSQIWRQTVIAQRGEYSRRLKLGRLTRGSESLSWGTPSTMDYLPPRTDEAILRQKNVGGRKNRKRPGNLREQVNPESVARYDEANAAQILLPTPTQPYGTGQNGTRGDGTTFKQAGKPSLNTMARDNLWPTPKVPNGGQGLPDEATDTGMMPDGTKRTVSLHNIVERRELFPTPDQRGFTNDGALNQLAKSGVTQEEFEGMAYRAGRAKKDRMWATPTEGDSKSSGSRNTPDSKAHSGRSLTDQVREDGGQGRLLPTPSQSSAQQGENAADGKRGQTLVGAARGQMWATPSPPNGGRGSPPGTSPTGKTPDGGKRQIGLEQQARESLWPTPTALDHKGSGVSGELRDRLDYAIERGATKSFPTPDVGAAKGRGVDSAGERSRLGGSLNAGFVEWLMGVPLGWSALDGELREHEGWAEEWPDVPRVTTECPDRVDRLRLLGNGVLPATAAKAWTVLTERMKS